jgi:hypothetical protein
MDLAGWRDIALWIIGFFYLLFSVVMAVALYFAWRYSAKGFKALDRLINQSGRPALKNVELQLLTIRDQTARLPGNASIGLGEAPARKSTGLLSKLPFGKKKRKLPLLPS